MVLQENSIHMRENKGIELFFNELNLGSLNKSFYF